MELSYYHWRILTWDFHKDFNILSIWRTYCYIIKDVFSSGKCGFFFIKPCLFVSFFSKSCYEAFGCHIHLWGLNHWGLHPCNPLQLTCDGHMCDLMMVISQHWVCIEWLLLPLPCVGGAFCYSMSCSPAIPSIW